MTAQRTDAIVIGDKEYQLYSLPLQGYLQQHSQRICLLGGTTDLYRGYYARWRVEDDRLYLIDFWGEHFLENKEYGLADLFPDQEIVFAYWFTGDLIVPVGKGVKCWHGGLGEWEYQYKAILEINKGIVVDSTFTDA